MLVDRASCPVVLQMTDEGTSLTSFGQQVTEASRQLGCLDDSLLALRNPV